MTRDKARGAGAATRRVKKTAHSTVLPGPTTRKTTKKARRWPFFVLLFLLLLGIAGYQLLHHKYFNIKYLKIVGNRNLSSEEITQALGEVNQNIILFSTTDAEKKLAAIDGIEQVRVTKDYPNQLLVEVQERFKLGRLDEKGERWIDQEGRIRLGGSQPVTNVYEAPLVTGIAGAEEAEEGADLSEDVRITQLLGLLMQSRLVGAIEKIDFEKPDNIDIIYKGIDVHFGSLNDLIEKISTLEAVIGDVETKAIQAKEIFLNRGEKPIVVTESGK